MTEKFYITWKDVEEMMEDLSQKLKDKHFDVIVAINRGGLVIGRLLSDRLQLPLGVITARAYKTESTEQDEKINVDYNVSMLEKLKGNILLVDDVVEYGNTLKTVKDWLEKQEGIDEITTAVCFRTPTTIIEPDYYARPKDKWVVFPYERYEDEKWS